jgi:type VI protein secretion system component VasF
MAPSEALDVVVTSGADTPLQHFHRADDGGQHVVEIMRDAAGELTDRLHLLRMAQRVLGLAQRRRRR